MVNQYKVFSAVMNNFDQAVKATEASLNSQGATAKQNAIYMESLEAKTQALKAQFEKLVLGDGGLQKIAKLFVDLGTNILKLANSDFGQLIIKVGLAVGALTALNKVQEEGLINNIGKFIKGIATMEISVESLTKAFITNAKTWLITPMGMVTVAVASIIVIKDIFNKLNVTIEEHNQKLLQLKQNYESAKSELEDTKNKLEDIRKKISDINSGKLEITDDTQLQKLKEQESVLSSQLAIQERKLEIAQREINLEAEKTLGKKVTFAEEDTQNQFGSWQHSRISGNSIEALDYYTQKINESQNAINDLMAQKQDLITQYGEESEQVKDINDKIAEEIEAREQAKDKATEYAETVQNATLGASDNIEVVQQGNEKLKNYAEAMGQSTDATKDQTEVTEQQKEELKALAEIWGIDAEEAEKYAQANDIDVWEYMNSLIEEQQDKVLGLDEAYKNSIQSLNDMASNFDTLSSVMNDYNNTGYLSIENLTKLLALDDEYLQLLQFENGQMSLNEQGIEAMANARIDEAEASAIAIAQEKLQEIATNDLMSAESVAGEVANGVIQANNSTANSVQTIIQKLNEGAQAWDNYWRSESKGTYQHQSSAVQAKAVTDSLFQQISALEQARANIGNYAKAVATGTQNTKGSTGATKANTKARDENAEAIKAQKTQLEAYIKTLEKEKEALEEQEDKYKTALDYMIKNLEKYIDWLEEARDAELDVIEAQIDALEKEQDSIMEIREKELKQLESEQDKLIEQRKEELESLKNHKEEVKDAYTEEIDKIKERNDSLNEQLELEKKIEAVANAKSKKVRVFRDGQFVYESDTSAVSKAQQELSDYQEELKRKQSIKELERERDSILAILDSEIDANKVSTEEIQKTYDSRIKVYKDTTQVMKDQYEQQKSILESQKQQIKDNYAEQIKEVQSYKDMLTQVKGAYKDFQDQMTTAEMTGLEFANKSYAERFKLIKDFSTESKQFYDKCVKDGKDFSTSYISSLSTLNDGLSKFVANFNATLDKIKNITFDISTAKAQLSDLTASMAQAEQGAYQLAQAIANANAVNQTQSTTANAVIPNRYKVYQIIDRGYKTRADAEAEIERLGIDATVVSGGGGTWNIGQIKSYWSSQSEASNEIGRLTRESQGKYSYGMTYASGVSSIKSDQIAVVGEDPNKEIVLGSKVNNGTLMSLDKGTGVVNAKSTNTLAGLLNLVGSFGRSNFGGAFGNAISNNSNSETIIIENVTIDGARITDIESFKNGLMSMKSEAIQRAYRR